MIVLTMFSFGIIGTLRVWVKENNGMLKHCLPNLTHRNMEGGGIALFEWRGSDSSSLRGEDY